MASVYGKMSVVGGAARGSSPRHHPTGWLQDGYEVLDGTQLREMAWQEGFEPPAPLSRKHVFSRDALSPVQALPQKMALGARFERARGFIRLRISNPMPYR